jgi:hypothetical protein
LLYQNAIIHALCVQSPTTSVYPVLWILKEDMMNPIEAALVLMATLIKARLNVFNAQSHVLPVRISPPNAHHVYLLLNEN